MVDAPVGHALLARSVRRRAPPATGGQARPPTPAVAPWTASFRENDVIPAGTLKKIMDY
jgi:hypothetical protein